MGFIRNLLDKRSDLALFTVSIILAGFSESIVNSTLNNYLNDSFTMDSFLRTFLELPRELPGFLVIFVTAALFFLPGRRLGFVSLLTGAAGLFLLAFASQKFAMMAVWLFIFSLGQHINMPLTSSIGMELAEKGKTGQRLGQLNSIRTAAIIAGSFFVFLGFQFFQFNYRVSFLIAGLFYIGAALFLYMMHPGQSQPAHMHLKLHREYSLYYWLSVLFGTRKQIFLTFAPWVLVTVYHEKTAMVATLFAIGGLCGIIFQPLLGKAVDTLGEKKVLMAEAIVLVFVCLGYGFAGTLLGKNAIWLAAVCFVVDQLLMGVNMARSTYMKKIAKEPGHVPSALAMSVSMDHIFSISVALLGGLIWLKWGYQMVFLAGAVIALINLVSAGLIRLPHNRTA